MTKYILDSGGLRKNPVKAALFLNEVTKDLGNSPKILVCFFARPREDWEKKFEEYRANLLKAVDDNIEPIIELAFPSSFVDQVKNNDAIIIYGGDDHLIQYWLRQYDLPNIWKDKVVATVSAGSDALVKSFWTCDWRQSMDGLGILPIKFIPHFNSDFGGDDPRGPIDWDDAYKQITKYGDRSLPIHALEEGDFIVINKAS
ncbi:MAG: Type 1 glutamine amidotransferase-like domain-containing protein [Patescibacteria group bacterium]|jgi:hypothetical protein